MAGTTIGQSMTACAAVGLPFAFTVGVVWGRPRITGPTLRPTGH
jgi:hypothetical protein